MTLPAGQSWRAILAGVLGAVLLLLLARGAIDHAVHYDELLHLLAARGLLTTGQPVIADGLYERAGLYTRAVAWCLEHFGDSAVSARIPALAAAAVLVLLVGSWLARCAGLMAGLSAGLLLAIVPSTLDVAVFARFYTFHAVVITLLGIVAYEAGSTRRSVQYLGFSLLGALALAALGWHFQETTIIALGAICVGLASILLHRHWTAFTSLLERRPALMLSSFVVLAGCAVIGLSASGLLQTFRTTAPWAARDAGRFQFYLTILRDDLPLLWPLLPAAAAYSMARGGHRLLALFSTAVVASALLVHSIAAQKTMRYVFYLLPWMTIVWALALARLFGVLRAQGARFAIAGLVALAAMVLLSREGARALNLLVGRTSSVDSRPFRDEPDWTPMARMLAPRITASDRIITSNSMKALYYIGRYDLELNATIVPETDTHAEFGRDERTGGRAIGRPESLARALDRGGRTLVLIEQSKIGRASGVDAATISVLDKRCQRVNPAPTIDPVAWWCTQPANR